MTRVGASISTNKRMPATKNHIAQGVICRKGRPGMRTAGGSTWGSLSVDDIRSGARKGERVLCSVGPCRRCFDRSKRHPQLDLFPRIDLMGRAAGHDRAIPLGAQGLYSFRVRVPGRQAVNCEFRTGGELRFSGRTLSGTVLRYDDVSPNHRERSAPGSFSPQPEVPLDLPARQERGDSSAGPFELKNLSEAPEIRTGFPERSATVAALERLVANEANAPQGSLLQVPEAPQAGDPDDMRLLDGFRGDLTRTKGATRPWNTRRTGRLSGHKEAVPSGLTIPGSA